MSALYLGADARVDVIDSGVRVRDTSSEALDVSIFSHHANVLFRLAASLMVAADDLDTASMARHPVGVGVPH